ncbi:DUF5703 domain-containing protein [Mangrovibacterium marinum]|uniref:DUF5703 domain-containing protein n=1 Tax=Mangrovibacterium marinum TaxID=1639118 RepID=A0A2T5C429_9BACT|nr:DUF5703 domain-containing protein [Mangrovibacterium marinum]PTN09532.1 hypothetical protein C8N47_10477 [Mangrovibacterium marinum]
MKKHIQITIAILLLFVVKLSAQPAGLNDYNLVWTRQSANSSESMPCGGGDVGLNVWVENGDLLFYVSQSGTFDENNCMLKLGRVRVKLSPNPFDGENFKQELHLKEGFVTIQGDHNGVKATAKLWVDVFRPVIHVEVDANQPVSTEATYESWRTEDRPLRKLESFANSYKWAAPEGLTTKADQVEFSEGGVLFCHRNSGETVFDVTVRQQQLDAVKDQLDNPLENLTFGGLMQGTNMVPAGETSGKYVDTEFKGFKLQSKTPSKKQELKIYLHTAQTASREVWKDELSTLRSQSQKQGTKAYQQTQKWWADFWNRSFVFIQPNNKNEQSVSWQVGRNYQLFRYMLACNAYGKYPTKFNGGLFTVDPVFTDSTRAFTADFRNWGGGTFTAQNQRLVYFPMLKNGDFDMLSCQFDFYLNTLKNATLRSQNYWGHDGACFTEQLENFGLPNPSEYGWKRPADYDPGRQYNAWLEYQWDTVLEFCHMILQDQQYSGADISKYLPLIESSLRFFDEHYRYLARERGSKELNADGQLVLYPGSACETYKMAYNSTSTIAALKTVTEELLALPEEYSSAIDYNFFAEMVKCIPPISFREIEGHKTIAPAKLWERVNNVEVPQLYPVYPWGMYGVGLPDLEVALNTWKYDPDALKFRSHKGWKQDAIFAARLGLTNEADSLVTLKLKDSGRRFPAFWGPGFDWTPDHNWGGSGMIALQEMLVQTVGDQIYLLPAWPRDRDVHFKLHLPKQTTVELNYENGRVEQLTVIPESRKADIQNLGDLMQ